MTEAPGVPDPEPTPLARAGWRYHAGTFAGHDQRAAPGSGSRGGPLIAELDVLVAEDLAITGDFFWVDERLARGPDDPRLDTVIERILDRLDRDDLVEGLLECEVYEPSLEKGTDGDDEIAFFTFFEVADLRARLADDQDHERVTGEELLAMLEDDPDDPTGPSEVGSH